MARTKATERPDGRVIVGGVAVDMQGYVDRLVQQDDLIRRQHKAIKQILIYAEAIPEITPKTGKSACAQANLLVRSIISTARISS